MTARMLAWKQPFIKRVRNSSLVENSGVDNNRVLSRPPKTWNWYYFLILIGRGAFHLLRRLSVRVAGVYGKANVGMSNDKEG